MAPLQPVPPSTAPSEPAPDPRADREVAALLRHLNPSQHEAVTRDTPRLRVLAGAGSGKTRVLTHRIAHESLAGRADPSRVLAVTFTRKAAGELRERLGRLGLRTQVQAGTFHAIAWAQLRQRWEERGVRPPELLDRKVGFVARLCPGRNRTLPLDIVTEIEWASARMVTPERYVRDAARAHRRPPLELPRVAEIYERYVAEKRHRRMVDFDDLIRLAARDLHADPVWAAARRWHHRHLYVDEFQDVNPLQHHLLSAWMGPESTLCVVGDPNQAIYAWNGADARYLVDFDEWFPGGHTVSLVDNYRSTPEVLRAANAVLAGGGGTPLRLLPHRPSGAEPTVRSFDDETAEARAVARAVRDRHRPNSPWSAQAVLVRTNAQAPALAEALGAAGIPHRVRGSASLLDQPEVRTALGALRRAMSVTTFLADCERTARLDSAHADGPPGDGDGINGLTDERRANLAELVRLGREYLALDPGGEPAAFGAWLASTLRKEDRAGGDAVEIVTFHAAKGLEWPIVHISGMEKGYVPIHHAEDDPDAVEEERRLLYVALTRARDELHLTRANRRAFGSRSLRRSPSPWLEPVLHAGGSGNRRLDRAETVGRARAARARLPATDGPAPQDRELFESLRSWRKAKATASDVPAYVIFNDATLRAVAERRPCTTAELLELPGIGAVKADRFGAELLELVRSAR